MEIIDNVTPRLIVQRKLFRMFREDGYVMSDPGGWRYQSDPTEPQDAISLLRGTSTERMSGFFRRKKFRMYKVATLWFQNSLRGASPTAQWAFEVYGAANMDSIQVLAELLEKRFSVNIRVTLLQNQPTTEAFAIDYCY